ncbi:hypothetical protein CRM84_00380 [Escherichia coli]|nr:hypothetical protein CRM84_00380 [Escherichia coli]
MSPVPKVTAQMLTEAIEQHGPQTADELALMFGITSRRANSSLAMAISKGCLIRVIRMVNFVTAYRALIYRQSESIRS